MEHRTHRSIFMVFALLLTLLALPPFFSEAAAKPSLSAKKGTLNISGTKKLSVKNAGSGSTLKWSSSNTKVAKVTKKGVVSALKQGKANITCKVTTKNKKTYTLRYRLTVKKPSLSKTSLSLSKTGQTQTLTIKNKAKGSSVTWKSSNSSIASVSQKGIVTAKQSGSATITATVKTKKNSYVKAKKFTLTCKVTVSAASGDEQNTSGISGTDSSSTGDSSNSSTGNDPDGTKENTSTITGGELTITSGDSSVEITKENGISTYALSKAGSYTIAPATDGTQNNVRINITAEGAVTLNLENVKIDNSSLTDGTAVLSIGKNVTQADIVLTGDSTLISDNKKSNIIEAKGSSTNINFSGDGSLTIQDGMEQAEKGAVGIYAGGMITFQSGTYTITTNRACVNGGEENASGGIAVNGGNLTLTSYQKKGFSSDAGNISITGGTVNFAYTYGDAINSNGTVSISGGKVTIDNCYGDGIQGETVDISDGTVDIKTYYEYAGINFYQSNAVSGSTYNSIKEEGGMSNNKIETVNYDTGSHKGIKAGSKAMTYSYTSVAEDSTNTAGTKYTQNASGGLKISGGTITIDTTKTGVKYNVGESSTIIGCPEDGIKSNNTAEISGGTIKISAADDGIGAANTLIFSGTADVTVATAYEGIEAGTIIVGTKDGSDNPSVSVTTNDDGINASSKTLTYVYADEDEEVYTKTSVSNSGNSFTIYRGTVTVTIADGTQSISLPVSGSNDTTVSFSADGDGIDCNGSFYGYGGTVMVFGSSGNTANSPIDADDTYLIGNGVTILAVGNNSMNEGPTQVEQAYITTSTNINAGSTVTVSDGTNTLLSQKLPKSASYLFFTAPGMTNGSSYTLNTGSASTTLTASTFASSGGGPGGNQPGGNQPGGPGGR